MSKALTKAQSDLEALRVELEAWINSQPATPKPARKPAVKRTRAQLLASATAPVVVAPAAPVEDEDTSWLDLLSTAPVAATVVAVEPAPVAAPAPLWVDATHLIRIDLTPEYVPRRTAPPRERTARRTMRQAFRDGYNGN